VPSAVARGVAALDDDEDGGDIPDAEAIRCAALSPFSCALGLACFGLRLTRIRRQARACAARARAPRARPRGRLRAACRGRACGQHARRAAPSSAPRQRRRRRGRRRQTVRARARCSM
jgi:hypothetical protein